MTFPWDFQFESNITISTAATKSEHVGPVSNTVPESHITVLQE